MPWKDEFDQITYDLADEKKAVLTYTDSDTKTRSFVKTFILFDENLNEIKRTDIKYDKSYERNYTHKVNNTLFLLLYDKNNGRLILKDINLLTLDCKSSEYEMRYGRTIEYFYLFKSKLTVISNGGKSTFLNTFDLISNESKEVDIQKQNKLALIYDGIDLTEYNLEKELVVKFKYKGKESLEYAYYIVDNTGSLKDNLVTIKYPISDKSVVSYKVNKVNNDEYLIMGLYTLKRYANGVFVARMKEGKVSYITYTNFVDIKNFADNLNYSNAKSYTKQVKKKADDNEGPTLNMLASIHDIKVVNGEYVMLMEFYYPTYRTEYRMVSTPSGGTTTQPYTVFDGYQYNSASIIGYDDKCNMMWSNSFSMYLFYKPYIPRTHIKMSNDGATVNLSYVNWSIVVRMYLKNGEFIKEREVNKDVFGKDSDDIVKRSKLLGVTWWYDNNILVMQTKKYREDEKSSKEWTFGLYKLEY
jgi:hypothetical protein